MVSMSQAVYMTSRTEGKKNRKAKMKFAQAFLRGDHREYTMSTRTCSS